MPKIYKAVLSVNHGLEKLWKPFCHCGTEAVVSLERWVIRAHDLFERRALKDFRVVEAMLRSCVGLLYFKIVGNVMGDLSRVGMPNDIEDFWQ